MLNKNAFGISAILIIAIILGGICFSEDLWTGDISKITVTDIDSKTSRIDIGLYRDEKISVPFEESKTISVESNQLRSEEHTSELQSH